MTRPDITQKDSDVTQKSSPTKSSTDKAKREERGRENNFTKSHADQSENLDDTRNLKYLGLASETVSATEITKSNFDVENINGQSNESGSTSNEACVRISNKVLEKIHMTKITESNSQNPCIAKSDKGVEELENKTMEIGSSCREQCFTKSNNVVEVIEKKTKDTGSNSKESSGTLCDKQIEEIEKNKDSSSMKSDKDRKMFESSDFSSTSKENSEDVSVPGDGVLQLHLSESANESEQNSCKSIDFNQYIEIVIIESDVDSTDSLSETNDNVRIEADMNSAKLECVQHEDSVITNTIADYDSSKLKDSDESNDYTDLNIDAQTYHCLGSERNEDDLKKDAIILLDSDSNEEIGNVNDSFCDTYSEEQKDSYIIESDKSETEALKKGTIMIMDNDSNEVEDQDDRISDSIKVKSVDSNSDKQKEVGNVHGTVLGKNFSRSPICNRGGNSVGVQSCEDIPEKIVDLEKAEELDKQPAAEQISNPEGHIRHDVSDDDNGIFNCFIDNHFASF